MMKEAHNSTLFPQFSFAVDGGWSEFNDWSVCSQTCGDGFVTRERRCDNPPPQHGGSQCVGESNEVQGCHNRRRCPSKSL